MFSGFIKSLPQISIFHHAASPQSTKALALLSSSLVSGYPKPSSPPLEFDLDVVESTPPTADQLKIIISYLASQKSSTSAPGLETFISSHPTSPSPSEHPQNAEGIAKLVSQNPNAFKWPVVVDWSSGRAAVGDVEGVKSILEAVRRKRDGETKDEESFKPKGWFS